jgi:hypothetical protein
MQWIDRLSRRLGLPEWVVALALIFAADTVLALGVVTVAVSSASAGGSAGGKVWTLDELRDRHTGDTPAQIRRVWGEESHEYFNRVTGEPDRLTYHGHRIRAADGRVYDASLEFHFSLGGRCTIINASIRKSGA